MKLRKLILSATMLLGITTSQAADFFDTSECDKLLDFGIRVGVNTSNRTVDNGVFNTWNHNAWGTGVDLGAVANINIRNYISVQPGLFFETRSGNHTYVMTVPGTGFDKYQVGHSRRYTLNIPVVASFHFNVTENLRWNVDLGPYFSWVLGHKDDPIQYLPALSQNEIAGIAANPGSFVPTFRNAEARAFDFGLKFGTGIDILQHYYFGIHYYAGMLDVWENHEMGGLNKCWVFSIGYNF